MVVRLLLALVAVAPALLVAAPTPSLAQVYYNPLPPKPTPPPARSKDDGQMLVQAQEVNYDNVNSLVAAVGGVQIFYNGTTLEADRVTYNQKTKRLIADGNVRMTDQEGRITYAGHLELSDDYRDGFVDSLRVDTADRTRMAATRADRSGGNFTVFQNGVYTACEACKDDPKKPPLWQVKAARVIHDQGEKMLYFESARLEFFGVPMAYMPYFYTPDPTVKRKTGFLMPVFSTNSKYGFGVQTPYYFALAPDYDLTLTPRITTKQGLLMQGEFRQRLINGAYDIRAYGIRQLDKDEFLRAGGPSTPGYRDFRGGVETSGRFAHQRQMELGLGWNAGLRPHVLPGLLAQPLQIAGRGVLGGADRRRLAALSHRRRHAFVLRRANDVFLRLLRGRHAAADSDHPPGDRLRERVQSADVRRRAELPRQPDEPQPRVDLLQSDHRDRPVARSVPADQRRSDGRRRRRTACCAALPATYTRLSGEATWRRSFTDSIGQIWTPFASVRADINHANVKNDIGVTNFLPAGDINAGRVMPTVGVEYRYPFISVQPWGSQTIEPIAQVIVRPNEQKIGQLPNEDAQSLVFDDTNLFSVEQVLRLGSQRRRRPGQRRHSGHDPVRSRRLRELPVRPVVSTCSAGTPLRPAT